jgi:four helix bundle protein
MPTIRRFEDLEVWQEARELVKLAYALTAKFPKQETFGLASQMQRAAVSVMSNIAEGFERGSNAEFIQFLYIARASCGELRSQCYVALDLGYASSSEVEILRERCQRLSRRLQTLIDYLKSSNIKGQKFHEERTTYELEQPET